MLLDKVILFVMAVVMVAFYAVLFYCFVVVCFFTNLFLSIFVTANRRRRHSIEDRYDSSIALPKRPRVFFSEEQKERLRQAYNRDPYPNQNTIEALANSLGVGVKTVINWFHNHRMRAKQQQHASSPTTPFSEYSQSGMSKEESNDDNSNNSDISSMSDNKEAALGFHSRFINSDSNQWMFPKFVPVNMSAKDGMQGSDDNNSEKDEGMEEEPMDDSIDAKDELHTTNDSDRDEDNDVDGDDHSISDDSHTEKSEWDVTKEQKTSITQSGGSNRRKRSHPQYVSAGRHLDRTVHRSDNLNTDSENNNDIDPEKENTNDNSGDLKHESYGDTDDTGSYKGLKDVAGSLEEKNNGSNIEKLHKTISQHSGEDWDF